MKKVFEEPTVEVIEILEVTTSSELETPSVGSDVEL